MSIRLLGAGTFNSGSSSCSWQVDYDSATLTIGHTVAGQAHLLVITAAVLTLATTAKGAQTLPASQLSVISTANNFLPSGQLQIDGIDGLVPYSSITGNFFNLSGGSGQVANGATVSPAFTEDVTGDLGKGRVVDVSNVPASAIPAPGPRGSAPPVIWTVDWSP